MDPKTSEKLMNSPANQKTDFDAEVASAEREARDCGTCGKPFQAIVVQCLGARIVAMHCPSCVQIHEADQAKRKADFAAAPAPSAEDRWAKLCPHEFRTLAEGGRTDVERLSAECPEFFRITGWKYGGLGLVLRGTSGLCKTRTMWRLLRRLFDEGRSLEALTAGEFGRSYADAAGRYEATAWFDRMTSVDVLFVDDLGKASWSEAVRAVFFDVIDKRMRTGLPLLVTTNDDGKQIAAKMGDPNFGDPLVRRLRDFCDILTMNGAAA